MSVILIVEDDEDIRDQLAEIISDAGHEVVTARHGREGLERLAERTDWSVILLDLMMPIMDGWSFRSAQLEHPTNGKVPVVLLSAAGDLANKAEKLKAAAFLSKPFRVEDLLATLGRLSRART